MPFHILNTEEVAQYLNLTSSEIEGLVKDNAIPFERRGERTVFRRPEIDAWASQRILGLSATRLAEYHQKWSQRSHSFLGSQTLVADLLPVENIQASLPAKTKASVIREMAALADGTGFVYDAAELVSSLAGREELCSTGVPGGVAFIHPRASQPYRFEASFLVLGRTVQPIHFGSPDGQPTDLFFLICCQDDKLHLHTLARLCLMGQKTDLLAELRAAESAAEMHNVVVSAEEKVVAKTVPGPSRG